MQAAAAPLGAVGDLGAQHEVAARRGAQEHDDVGLARAAPASSARIGVMPTPGADQQQPVAARAASAVNAP